ncbi:DUF4209 domain-containing protein [Chitinophaga sp. GCM10012297]|uniref:DUF4209 domain-containing protein n=1 Tax=Chitinophaga chungangae TaxID=2821488 RepID=A0ABS3YJ19_9BACT|nr:DUF4209 domain-containing protein [Chitinophaga chungangae]MBO9154676.1 DUF4209 domain-containing protein [Chitinophaga chungangae]
MSQHDSILKLLTEFDDNQLRPIKDDLEIARMIRGALPEDEDFEPLVLAELYAFSLLEDNEYGKANWQTYFGPALRNSGGGEVFEAIPLTKISKELLDYWESRINQCSNPILKSRYAGLVWEFSKKIRNTKPDFDKVGLVYVNSLLQAGQAGRYVFSQTVFKKLSRALTLALSFRNKALTGEAIEKIRKYAKEHEDSKKPGIWRHNYDLIVKDKLKEIDESIIAEIVDDLEGKFSLGLTPKPNGRPELNSAHVALDRLLDYYKKINDKESIKRLLGLLATAYEAEVLSIQPVQAIHLLGRLNEYYKTHNLFTEAIEVYKRIQALSPAVLEAMVPIATEFKVSKDTIDDFVAKCMLGDAPEVLSRLATAFIPSKDSKLSVFGGEGISALLTKSLHDGSGRTVAKVGPKNVDINGNEVMGISTNMSYGSVLLHFCITAGKTQSLLTVGNIMEYLKCSCLIAPDRYGLIEAGISAYLKGDFVVSLHILIPQFEAACLKLVELNGGSIWREGKNGGDNVRVLDDILRDELIVDSFGEDESFYLRVLFTDQRGWNLRNKVCHGMMKTNGFDYRKADRVFVAFLLLGLIKFQEFEPSLSEN